MTRMKSHQPLPPSLSAISMNSSVVTFYKSTFGNRTSSVSSVHRVSGTMRGVAISWWPFERVIRVNYYHRLSGRKELFSLYLATVLQYTVVKTKCSHHFWFLLGWAIGTINLWLSPPRTLHYSCKAKTDERQVKGWSVTVTELKSVIQLNPTFNALNVGNNLTYL